MRNKRILIWAVLFVMAFSSAVGFAQPREVADLILHNATIYTMDEANPIASAIAIKGDRILAIGEMKDVARFNGKGSEMINMKKKTIIPGLTDSHVHFSGVGNRLLIVDAYWLPKAQIIQNIADAVAKAEPGAWIQARGFNQEIWDPKVWPTKEDLDAVSPNNPVYIRRYCGHAAWVNSKALEVAGIDKNTVDPPDGSFLRDAEGNPTGILLASGAMRAVNKFIPPWSPEQVRQSLIMANDELIAVGLVGIHEAGSSRSMIEMVQGLYEEGELDIRIYQMVRFAIESDYKDLNYYLDQGPQIGLYDNKYTIRSVKMSLDGALGARTAAFLEPYSDWDDQNWLGQIRVQPNVFNDVIQRTAAAGFQSRTHNIGDRANRLTLDAYENVKNTLNPEDPRFVIEHAQILHPDDIPRFAQLGIIASMQTIHATEDMIMAEDRVGPVRILGGYAWRTLLDSGVVITNGSDASVSPFNPFFGMHAAVTRQDRNNSPEGGWYPAQVMTRQEALASYTVAPAYTSFEEDLRGSLEPGKLADLVVIDRDIMDESKVPAEDIWKTEVLMTMIGGKFVYVR